MLNLKKGLALVLAAATAFTFAPVANLGNAVQANAAEAAGENLEVTYDASTGSADITNGVSKEFSLKNGTYLVVLPKDSTGAVATKGLKVAVYQSGTQTAINNDFVLVVTGAATQKAKFTVGGTSQTANDNGDFTINIKKISDVSAWETSENPTATPSAAQAKDMTSTQNNTLKVTVKGVKKPSVEDLSFRSGVQVSDGFKQTLFGANTYHVLRGTDNYVIATQLHGKTQNGTNATALSNNTNYYWTATAEKGYVQISDANTQVAPKKAGDDIKLGNLKFTGLTAGTDKVTIQLHAAVANDSENTYYTSATNVKKDEVIAEQTYDFVVEDDATNINSFTWVNPNGKISYLTGTTKPAGVDDKNLNNTSGDSSITLDPIVKKTQQIDVSATGALTYVSSDNSVATVSSNGLISAVAPGRANITVYAAPAGQFTTVSSKTLAVVVSADSKDVISVKANGENADATTGYQVDLDPSTQTAATAVHSVKLDAQSAAGFTVNYKVVKDNTSGKDTFGDSAIATVTSDGTINAGSKDGTVYVRLETADKDKVKGAEPVYVKVVVNKLPQADIDISDVRLDLKNNKSVELNPTSSVKDTKFGYILNDDATKIVDLRGSKLTAKALGYGKITVTATATAKTRYTKKDINVAVVDNAAKTDSDLKVASSALTVKVGDTASAGASTTASGAAITYTSSDTDVATVAADGTITAVAPGTAVVTVKAAETDTVNAGTATIVVTVPSNPQKVTGVKVSNKKGAYVTVKWTSQGGNVNYRIYKKVGNGKWIGKNVAGSKTTLKVKKGAKVQVKVKAYVKDSTGKTTWGPKATKAKTFKTDKK